MLRAIRDFGAYAVLGNAQLSAAEIRAMQMADIVISAYRDQHNTKNRAEWTRNYPKLANLLAQIAIQVANGKHD